MPGMVELMRCFGISFLFRAALRGFNCKIFLCCSYLDGQRRALGDGQVAVSFDTRAFRDELATLPAR